MIVIPSIDLRQGQVVRLQQGDYARQLNYAVDPLETAHSLRRRPAQNGCTLSISTAPRKAGPCKPISSPKSSPPPAFPVQVGGGIRRREDIDLLLESASSASSSAPKPSKIGPGSNPSPTTPHIATASSSPSTPRTETSPSAGWTQTTGRTATDVATQISNWPVAAILYTDVAKDGMMTGPNFQQTQAIAQAGKSPSSPAAA